MSKETWRVSIVGVGGLGGALTRGLLRSNVAPSRLSLCDVDPAKLEALTAGQGGMRTSQDAREAAQDTDIVVLAVKPGAVASALDQVGDAVRPDSVVISVAAGVQLPALRTALGARGHLVRAMPNVNVAVMSSVTGLCGEPDGWPEAMVRAQWLFGAVGSTVVVPDEAMMDATTALAASGPAFLALVMEALMDGGVKAGLPRPMARAMAVGMVEGTARHLRERPLHPGELKDMVMSPAGTTAAGLLALEERGVRGALIDAVDVATRRARELRAK